MQPTTLFKLQRLLEDRSFMRKTISLIAALLTVSITLNLLPFDRNAAAQSRGIDGGKASSDQRVPEAAFTPGNLVIYRVGDGVAALTNAATPVFLDEYTPAGTLVQSIALPTAVSGANRRLTASGTATSEGLITRSVDGQYLLLAGYDTDVGTASITGSTSAAINRVIGRATASGTVDTTTALGDAMSGGNPRGVASTNGNDLWLSGTSSGGGVRYTTLGSTTSTSLVTTPTNIRAMGIFDGQLYVSSMTGAFRLSTVGTGTPTTAGQTMTNLPGFPTATTTPYQFFFADLSPGVAGVDTVFVSDDGASGGVLKYSLVGGSWVANGTIALSSSRGLTATISGSTVTFFVTNGTTLQTAVDSTGYNVAPTATFSLLATAGTFTAFRGLAFAPATTGGNPGSIQFTSPTLTVAESGAFATITASRTGGTDGSVGVSYATSNGTATAGPPCNAPGSDYNAATGSLVWGPGDAVDKFFTFPICDDADFEGDETVNVTMTSPTGGATIGTPSSVVVTITDNDPQPAVIQFSSSTYFGDESQTAILTVTRSGDTSGTSTVDVASSPVTAIANPICGFGGDYIPLGTTLTFSPGITSREYAVPLCADAFTEPTESLNATLSNPGGTATVLGSTTVATLSINDTASKFRNEGNIAIEDGAQAAASSIVVEGEAGPVGSIRVTLYDVQHLNASDIDVLLVGPGGQNIVLMSDAGGAAGLTASQTLTFVDSAGQVLPQNGAFSTAQYEPTSWTPGQPNFNAPAPAGPYNEPGSGVGGGPNLTSVFNGTNPNGTWTLYIRDDNGAAIAAGGINGNVAGGWGIEIFTQPGSTTSISGTARTINGAPIRNAFIQISGGNLPQPRFLSTNFFGNYNFAGLQAGQVYTIQIAGRRHTFSPNSATFTSNSNLSGADFLGTLLSN